MNLTKILTESKIEDLTILVWDFETTVKDLNGKTDNTPFNKDNRCVGVWWCLIKNGVIGEVQRLVWNHNDKPQPDGRDVFQMDLGQADLIVAHNAKFDAIWLQEMGFSWFSPIFCTMIGEFIFARGVRSKISLKDTAERRGVTRKKSDLVDDMFKDGIGFEAMPLPTVDEYATADVISCAEIFLAQMEELAESKTLIPVFVLMNEMLEFLVEIERNGIKINTTALLEVKSQYIKEREELIKRLTEIARQVLGDTPFNLNSGIDQTKIFYSRVVTDKELHKRMFNIGVDPVTGRSLHPPRMNAERFAGAVRATCKVIKKTIAIQCPLCNGYGTIQKYTVKGAPYKNRSKCHNCSATGAIYRDTDETAGLRLSPKNSSYASIHGFKTDKGTCKLLLKQATDKGNTLAIEFIEKMMRLNAVNTYIDSFITGIETWTREDGLLHANFNQTRARTGRLSSSNPNFQNQPKSNKFPVRKCVVSRFENGLIVEADFVGLEFRVAGELSRDPQIISDILSGKDVHKQTASIINRCDVKDVTKSMRQAAKSYTFSPLYGGLGMSEPEHIRRYFQEYFEIYSGLKHWHQKLMNGVLETGIVQTPSGREFRFPNTERLPNGRVTNATNIVNYPVQSFATADCVPLACIRALQFFRMRNLRSKLIITVHDSVVVDCHPDEIDAVKDGLTWAMEGVKNELKTRFNYEAQLPLDIEIEGGKSWMEMTEMV